MNEFSLKNQTEHENLCSVFYLENSSILMSLNFDSSYQFHLFTSEN
jgi:hypothetical protein